MNTNLSDALLLATSVKNGTEGLENIEIVLAPPFVWLYPMAETLHKVLGKRIKLSAQNLFWEDSGAYTGEVSGKMLNSMCQYVVIGHSERRQYLLETDEMINEKVHSALRNGLKPIICVGENIKMQEDKKTRGRPKSDRLKGDILHQLSASLDRVPKKNIPNIVIAYEPVWAIGTGRAATGAYAASIINMLREKIFSMYDLDTAMQVRILYGGSVNSDNISEFIRQPEIDGVLAGGASLKAKEFIKMCREMA
jgi:triosephosphate isomerase